MNADNLNMSFNNEVFNQGKLWQDGWYIYSQGEVSGPYKAEQVFGFKRPSFDTDQISVSRKGLSRWYDYQSLQKIFREQTGLNAATKRESKLSRNILKQEPEKKLASEKKIRSKHLGIKRARQSSLELNEVNNLHFKKFGKSQATEQAKESQNNKSTDSVQQSLAYYHLTLKGRLRLGALHNPLTLIFKMLITFGYGWKSWYEQAMIECSYHIDDPNALENLKGAWKVMIPGPHLFKIYSLARIVLQMEVQNHYRRTSPLLSFLLSLVPPLAVLYLQSAINKHWRLHICHFIQNKKYS